MFCNIFDLKTAQNVVILYYYCEDITMSGPNSISSWFKSKKDFLAKINKSNNV